MTYRKHILFHSFYLLERWSKRSLLPLLMTSGLVPISPVSQTPRWIRPKPKHCSEPWAVKKAREDLVGVRRRQRPEGASAEKPKLQPWPLVP